jgi:hypothetical protein
VKTLRSQLILVLVTLWASLFPLQAGEKEEKEKITALISHVEGLKGASFIRNGKTYDSKTAGEFLRRKWEAKSTEIKSAAGFIETVASVSSTSGQPYLIRFGDGKETKCGDYLKHRLAELEKPRK